MDIIEVIKVSITHKWLLDARALISNEYLKVTEIITSTVHRSEKFLSNRLTYI